MPPKTIAACVITALVIAGCATPEESVVHKPPNMDVQKCTVLAGGYWTGADAEYAASIALDTTFFVAGVVLTPVMLAGYFTHPGYVNSNIQALGSAARHFQELERAARGDLRTVAGQKREAAAKLREDVISTCIEVLSTERKFGTDSAELVAPLVALGDAYNRAQAMKQALEVYRRAIAIADTRYASTEGKTYHAAALAGYVNSGAALGSWDQAACDRLKKWPDVPLDRNTPAYWCRRDVPAYIRSCSDAVSAVALREMCLDTERCDDQISGIVKFCPRALSSPCVAARTQLPSYCVGGSRAIFCEAAIDTVRTHCGVWSQ